MIKIKLTKLVICYWLTIFLKKGNLDIQFVLNINKNFLIKIVYKLLKKKEKKNPLINIIRRV